MAKCVGKPWTQAIYVPLFRTAYSLVYSLLISNSVWGAIFLFVCMFVYSLVCLLIYLNLPVYFPTVLLSVYYTHFCLFVCLSFCLFIRLFVCLSVFLFVCLFNCLCVCLFVCLFVGLSVRLFLCFLCLFVYSFVCLFVCLFIRLFVCLSVCLFIRLFTCWFIWICAVCTLQLFVLLSVYYTRLCLFVCLFVLCQATGWRLGTIVLSLSTVVACLVFALYSSWKLAVLVVAFLPFIMAASTLQMKALTSGAGNEDELHEFGAVSTISSVMPPFHSHEWSISNFPCSLTSNITSHSMENLAFHSLLRWKMIVLPILTTSLIHFFERWWENVLFELGTERIKRTRKLRRRGGRQPGVYTVCCCHSLWQRENARNVSYCLFHGAPLPSSTHRGYTSPFPLYKSPTTQQ